MASDTYAERSRDEILPTLLFNETYADLHLRASDGVVLAANRCVLALRSPIFHAMLYGHFVEASKDIIEIPSVSGKALRSVLEYIYTDRSSLLEYYVDDDDDGDEEEEEEDEVLDEELEEGENNNISKRQINLRTNDEDNSTDRRLQRIQELFDLADAAKYFALTILANRAMKRVAIAMAKHPFQALEYFARHTNTSTSLIQTWKRQIADGSDDHDAVQTHCPFKELCAVVAVGVAANQLELPDVCSRARCWIAQLHWPYTNEGEAVKIGRSAFAVMAACWPHRKSEFASKVEEDAAGRLVRELGQERELLPLANPEIVRQIIRDMKRYPYRQFLLLQKWATDAGNNVFIWKGVNIPMESMCNLSISQRQVIAQRMAEELIDKLEYVHRNELTHQVMQSGCVSEAQIARVLRTQQDSSQQAPQWWTAKSNVSPLSFRDRNVDRFDCAVMRSGVHYWTVHVEAMEESEIWLGVVRPDNPNWSGLWFTSSGAHQFAIGCGRGFTTGDPATTLKSTGFRTGSYVTFELDLRVENTENGTLSVCVGDSSNSSSSSFQICFSNLLARPGDRENGFWPAAKSSREAQVRIVSITSE